MGIRSQTRNNKILSYVDRLRKKVEHNTTFSIATEQEVRRQAPPEAAVPTYVGIRDQNTFYPSTGLAYTPHEWLSTNRLNLGPPTRFLVLFYFGVAAT